MLKFKVSDTFVDKNEPDTVVSIESKHAHGYELSNGDFVSSDDAMLSRFEPLAAFAAPIKQVHITEEDTPASALRVQANAPEINTFEKRINENHPEHPMFNAHQLNITSKNDDATIQAFVQLNKMSKNDEKIHVTIDVGNIMNPAKIKQFTELYDLKQAKIEECIKYVLLQNANLDDLVSDIAKAITKQIL